MASSEFEKCIYEQKIEHLTDQNNQLRQQLEILKATNDTLIASIANLKAQAEDYSAEIRNRELQELLDIEHRRVEELEIRRHTQVKALKDELEDKNMELERMRIQHQKQVFRLRDEMKSLKISLKDRRSNEVNDDLSRSIALTSYLADMRQSQQNIMDRSNQFNYSNIERVSRSPIQSRISVQKNRVNPSISSYQNSNSFDPMKMSKEELKIYIKTLSKAEKKFRQGEKQASLLAERQSQLKQAKNRKY